MISFGRAGDDFWDSYFLRDWSAHRPPANLAFYQQWIEAAKSLSFAAAFDKVTASRHSNCVFWQNMIAWGTDTRHALCKELGLPWGGMDFPFLPYRHYQATEFPAYITPAWPLAGNRDDVHQDFAEYQRWSTWAGHPPLDWIVFGESLRVHLSNCRMFKEGLNGMLVPDAFATLGLRFRRAAPKDQIGDFELLLVPSSPDDPAPQYPMMQLVPIQIQT